MKSAHTYVKLWQFLVNEVLHALILPIILIVMYKRWPFKNIVREQLEFPSFTPYR